MLWRQAPCTLVRQSALPAMPGQPRLRWLAARKELLPTRYVHAVFTLPRELAPMALEKNNVIFNL
jgi:hypothetical protein